MAAGSLIDALRHVVQEEGGYVDHPSDPGGATNFGQTRPWLESLYGRTVTKAEIKALTHTIALDNYLQWCRKHRLSDVYDISPIVGEVLIDFCVNSGHVNRIRAMQRALHVTADGIIGKGTLGALTAADPTNVATEILAARLELFARIARGSHPFIEGWLLRVARQLRRVWT